MSNTYASTMRNLRPSSLSRTLALVPPAVALIAQQSQAGFNVFLKIDTIPGEVTEKGREGWIKLNSALWATARAISSPTGGAGDREASKPSISEVVVTKSIDSTSSKLFLAAVAGEPTATPVILEVVDDTTLQVYYRLTLDNVMVSSQSNSAATGATKGDESISLNFTKITVASFGPKGTVVHSGGYDLLTGKAF
jgi:type VI secretion system secreted protein Hcp